MGFNNILTYLGMNTVVVYVCFFRHRAYYFSLFSLFKFLMEKVETFEKVTLNRLHSLVWYACIWYMSLLTHTAHTQKAGLDERCRCSAGGLKFVCVYGVVHTKASLCRDGQGVLSSLQRVCAMCMLGNQYMHHWLWHLPSQCFPIPTPKCLSSSSISSPSVLYCPIQSASLLSKQHFVSQNTPAILHNDLLTNNQ